MTSGIRMLNAADMSRVVEFCDQDPVANLSLISRLGQWPIGTSGVHAAGYEINGELTAVCYLAGGLMVSGDDDAALSAFANRFGRVRVGSILGRASAVLGLHNHLVRDWGGFWAMPRNIRGCQPLMLWAGPSEVQPEPSLRRLTEEEFPSYFNACVNMYTEEIGASPLASGPGYDTAVRDRLRSGAAYGVVRDGRVLFKADLGAVHGDRVQVQGVWLDPVLRGRGLAAPAMTALINLIKDDYPKISLYVNDFNTRAIRTYERCGFVRVGALATVHY